MCGPSSSQSEIFHHFHQLPSLTSTSWEVWCHEEGTTNRGPKLRNKKKVEQTKEWSLIFLKCNCTSHPRKNRKNQKELEIPVVSSTQSRGTEMSMNYDQQLRTKCTGNCSWAEMQLFKFVLAGAITYDAVADAILAPAPRLLLRYNFASWYCHLKIVFLGFLWSGVWRFRFSWKFCWGLFIMVSLQELVLGYLGGARGVTLRSGLMSL